MGRKVAFQFDPKILAVLILGVSLIVTTGCLGSLDNDDDNTDEIIIPDHPQIVRAEGMVDEGGNISMVFLDVDLYGDRGVDMRDVVVHILATPNGGSAAECDLTYGSFDQMDPESYVVRELFDPNNTWDPEGTPGSHILGKECLLELEVNLTASGVPLPPDSTLEIILHVTTSAHETYDLFRTPSGYPATGTVLLED
ncbi:MAG: hypothetical protein ACMUHU_06070 [Thermoplasmatota archaeon]